jgi:maltooligosyltrehalose trehalohydrolase
LDSQATQLGALLERNGVEFRVWAPNARSVDVVLRDGAVPLEHGAGGVFAGSARASAGDDYRFALDGGEPLPDPCSRWQPEGLLGPSRVLDVGSFDIRPGPGLQLDELVIYELHVGAFTREGTFEAAVAALPELRELGVTAVELMPVATSPGERNWGYDGVYTSAPHAVYGGPRGLARLVDAAHAAGLGVLLDVVYNHLGPGSRALTAFGPYHTDRHATFWGAALDYSERAVREWAIQNAELWVRDYRVDGLRLDAVHAVFDDGSPTHVLRELRDRVKEIDAGALVISEMELGDLRPVETWGHDAQWVDALHHELHVLLTGERDGYYADFGSVDGLAEALRANGRFVVCAQNHDQVGNRALGDRLPPDLLRVASAVICLSGSIPLLFMGEEYLETRPFRFFTDHVDPEVAESTRRGRKEEFGELAGFQGEVPDPQDPATFEASKLDRRPPHPWYRELLRVRREHPGPVGVDANGDELRLRRGAVEAVADFAAKTVELRA